MSWCLDGWLEQAEAGAAAIAEEAAAWKCAVVGLNRVLRWGLRAFARHLDCRQRRRAACVHIASLTRARQLRWGVHCIRQAAELARLRMTWTEEKRLEARLPVMAVAYNGWQGLARLRLQRKRVTARAEARRRGAGLASAARLWQGVAQRRRRARGAVARAEARRAARLVARGMAVLRSTAAQALDCLTSAVSMAQKGRAGQLSRHMRVWATGVALRRAWRARLRRAMERRRRAGLERCQRCWQERVCAQRRCSQAVERVRTELGRRCLETLGEAAAAGRRAARMAERRLEQARTDLTAGVWCVWMALGASRTRRAAALEKKKADQGRLALLGRVMVAMAETAAGRRERRKACLTAERRCGAQRLALAVRAWREAVGTRLRRRCTVEKALRACVLKGVHCRLCEWRCAAGEGRTQRRGIERLARRRVAAAMSWCLDGWLEQADAAAPFCSLKLTTLQLEFGRFWQRFDLLLFKGLCAFSMNLACHHYRRSCFLRIDMRIRRRLIYGILDFFRQKAFLRRLTAKLGHSLRFKFLTMRFEEWLIKCRMLRQRRRRMDLACTRRQAACLAQTMLAWQEITRYVGIHRTAATWRLSYVCSQGKLAWTKMLFDLWAVSVSHSAVRRVLFLQWRRWAWRRRQTLHGTFVRKWRQCAGLLVNANNRYQTVLGLLCIGRWHCAVKERQEALAELHKLAARRNSWLTARIWDDWVEQTAVLVLAKKKRKALHIRMQRLQKYVLTSLSAQVKKAAKRQKGLAQQICWQRLIAALKANSAYRIVCLCRLSALEKIILNQTVNVALLSFKLWARTVVEKKTSMVRAIQRYAVRTAQFVITSWRLSTGHDRYAFSRASLQVSVHACHFPFFIFFLT